MNMFAPNRRVFPLPVTDLFARMLRMNPEERGFHITLLCQATAWGPIEDDDKLFKAWFGFRTVKQVARVRALLEREWELTDEGWVCPWLEEILRRKRLPLSPSVRRRVIERDESICGLCGEPVGPDEKLHIDHIVPVVLGGTDDEDNLQVAHASCNLSKGARTLEVGQ